MTPDERRGPDCAGERWAAIAGFEGRYDVSDLGRVRSWIPWRARSVPHLLADTSKGSKRHRMILLRKSGDPRRHMRLIHRLVLEAFVGPCPSGCEVRHLDGDPTNNRLTNLAYGTHSENELDKLAHRTHVNANKTHCPRGHEYNDENTCRNEKGHRWCRACQRVRSRKAAA